MSNASNNRVWKGFCVIRDSAEIERVIREYRKNPAVIREFRIGCEAGFLTNVGCLSRSIAREKRTVCSNLAPLDHVNLLETKWQLLENIFWKVYSMK